MGKRKNPLANVAGTAGTPVMKMVDPKSLKMNLETNRQSGFDKESIDSLAGSLKDQGMLEPVIVQEKANGELWVVDGHRRTTAALTIEGFLVPAIIKPELSDEQEFIIKIVANEQREDASPIDRAKSMAYAKEAFNWNQNKIAEIFDCYPADVSRDLSLLRLPKKIQTQVHNGKMTMKDALKLIPLSQQEKDKLADEAEKKIKEMEEKGATPHDIRREVTKEVEKKVPTKTKKNKSENKTNLADLMNDEDAGDIEDKRTYNVRGNKEPEPEPEEVVGSMPTTETQIRLQGLARLLDVFMKLETNKPDTIGGKIATILVDLFEDNCNSDDAVKQIVELG